MVHHLQKSNLGEHISNGLPNVKRRRSQNIDLVRETNMKPTWSGLKKRWSRISILMDIFCHLFIHGKLYIQNCTFLSIAHLMCYRYAVINNQKTFATGIRKWSRPLRDFPTPKFSTTTEMEQWKVILEEIYSHLCLTDGVVEAALRESGPRPFSLTCLPPWGGLCDV